VGNIFHLLHFSTTINIRSQSYRLREQHKRLQNGESQCRPEELDMIPQHRFLGVGMEVDLLLYPLGHRVAVQVMLE
jgi:hypothetical protein